MTSQTHKEFEVLNQIAMAINHASDLDALLIAVHKQIRKLLPIDRLGLILTREGEGGFQQQFLYQNDRVLVSTRAPKPLPEDFPEKAAILQGETTTLSTQKGAWLIAPLTAEQRAIGALCLGSPPSAPDFDPHQRHLVSLVANLISIPISKTRLLQEAQDQARHLALLNDINRQLTPTLDREALLNAIVRGAMRITPSASGALLTLDDSSGELTCQATAGPLSAALAGLRLPKRGRVAKKTIIQQQSVILNTVGPEDIGLDPSPPELMDQIENLMAVPLRAQDKAFGVLLLFNKRDGQAYTAHDVARLEGFASQAAMTMHNVRRYEALQDAVQAKNEYIDFISHELKNPLTAIKGHADILAKGMAGEINQEQADFLRTISHNVRRMNTFITDLSDQSHIESQSLRMIFEPTAVKPVVDEVLQSYSQQIREKDLTVRAQIKKSIPDVWADRLRLIQILSNLVSNAIKYTPQNGVIVIGAKQTSNQWESDGAPEVAHFWVQDNGYGISPEDQRRLFNKFHRGTNEIILKIPGTGLGLHIAKSLTGLMGGVMWFESEPDKGSTFHFTIPTQSGQMPH